MSDLGHQPAGRATAGRAAWYRSFVKTTRLASGPDRGPAEAARPRASSLPARMDLGLAGVHRLIGESRGEGLPAALEAPLGKGLARPVPSATIHVDAAAGRAARALGARAFTRGSSVYFGEGAWQPGSEAGQRLLAHELAHVARHHEGRLAPPVSGSPMSAPGDEAEREAEQAERAMVPTRASANQLAARPPPPSSPPANPRSTTLLRAKYGDAKEPARADAWKLWAATQRPNFATTPADLVHCLRETNDRVLVELREDNGFALWVRQIAGQDSDAALEQLGLPTRVTKTAANPLPTADPGAPARVLAKVELCYAPPMQIDALQVPAQGSGTQLEIGTELIVSGVNVANPDWLDVDLRDDPIASTRGVVPRQSVVELPQTDGYADLGKVPLFGGAGPVADDVAQGAVGDCYLHAGLLSIVASEPALIRKMMIDEGKRVLVRFYDRQIDQQRVTHTPRWFAVTKEVVVRTSTVSTMMGWSSKQVQTPVFAAVDTALWPAMIEKAWAVRESEGKNRPSYAYIAASETDRVFEAILGRSAESDRIPLGESDGNPIQTSRAKLVSEWGLTETQAGQFVAAVRKAPPGVVADKALAGELVRAVLERDNPLACRAMLDYIGTRFEGGLGSKDYSPRARLVFASILESLAEGKKIAIGTAAFPESHDKGPSGENLSVAGLAGPHAYAVIGAVTSPTQRYYLQVRNPWGATKTGLGRGYVEQGPLALQGVAKPGIGEFYVELSDVMRYFASIYVG